MTNRSLEQLAWEISGQPAGLATRIRRAAEIFAHYDKVQILHRLSNVAKAKLNSKAVIGSVDSVDASFEPESQLQKLAAIVLDHRKDHPCHSRCDLETGSFDLLNSSASLFTEGCFDASLFQKQPQLWRFQFHYHDYLINQLARGNEDRISKFLESWLDVFDPAGVRVTADAWHPYCISRRVITWILLEAGYQNRGSQLCEGPLRGRLLSSLVAQCNYLQKNLERDLGGNHILENVTALAMASQSVDTADAKLWRSTAVEVLKSELAAQILDSGEHFELSPMYHCHVLGNLLRIKASCAGKDSTMEDVVTPSINSMIEFLSALIHPDGEIPLFADSGFHEAPSTAEIFDCCELLGHEMTESDLRTIGGYEIFRDQGMFAICDFGNIAAANLPAHGHCDATNLVASIKGTRWIVDSGNFNYENDPMRHYCRSSIGHNVVTVDNANQANAWLKFRMGRRPRLFGRKRGSDNGWNWASGSHDGYSPLGTDKVTRIVACRESTLACVDFASGGEGKLIGYLHFHPNVAVAPGSAARGIHRLELKCDGIERVLSVACDEVEILDGWHCPEFGVRQSGRVIRYATNLTTKVLGWALHEPGNNPDFEFNEIEGRITMCGQPEFEFRL